MSYAKSTDAYTGSWQALTLSNVANGSLLAWFASGTGGGYTATPSTTSGNTSAWTSVANYSQGATDAFLYYAYATSAGNVTVNGSGTLTDVGVALIELTNIVNASPIDGAFAGDYGADANDVAFQTANISTSQANTDFIAWWASETADRTITANGWTPREEDTGHIHKVYTRSVNSQAEYNFAGTLNSGIADGNWQVGVVAFKGTGANAATFTQEGYRWRNDDGDEANATWTASQDTGITAPANAIRRLRIVIDTSGDTNAALYQLEYKEANDANWTKVT